MPLAGTAFKGHPETRLDLEVGFGCDQEVVVHFLGIAGLLVGVHHVYLGFHPFIADPIGIAAGIFGLQVVGGTRARSSRRVHIGI